MFSVGDTAYATTELVRADGRGSIHRGDEVTITNVYTAPGHCILDIESRKGVRMIDIVCFPEGAPLQKAFKEEE